MPTVADQLINLGCVFNEDPIHHYRERVDTSVPPGTDDQVCNFVTIAEVPSDSEVGSEMLESTIFVKPF